ncbi:MAG TPA: glycosyltransferase [Candidatus Ozemobacteraceae bacterium]|nr:glycosyltransferase [Candidatus Ozemobacteraceae bacterium]
MKNPVLTICIPTYNRASFLEKTLASIVSQRVFLESNDVEIVVSDNASTDNTPEVVKQYQTMFHGKIVSIRSDIPVGANCNFERSMRYGKGEFLKLHNDSFLFLPGGVEKCLQAVRDNGDASIIYIHGMKKLSIRERVIENVNDLVRRFSYHATWAGAYFFRRDVYEKVQGAFEQYEPDFPHLDILLRILEEKKKVVACSIECLQWQKMIRKQRNEAEIFGNKYINILEESLKKGLLDKRVFAREKCQVLFWHIIPFYFDFFNQFTSDHFGLKVYWDSMRKYHREIYFYISLYFLVIYSCLLKIIPLRKIAGKMKNTLACWRDMIFGCGEEAR